ncbi:helix-turn-helix domain-containing protein [Curvibacter sp. APW13]|uniref:sigma-54-dependent Fis family transcriptional regulator n=1 Tax=Curvibacter sp. APW13 TaxID=3077236 RepID=UPI0028DFBC61|nr:helix-turn-helix domain-containing protein [Curvibacter sp. APW13]MDT8990684.1 helix-turn-helix domain-containing protein [Curvibacter sp. APW13]
MAHFAPAHPASALPPAGTEERLRAIAAARRHVMQGGADVPLPVESWIERSWRRCLGMGLDPRRNIEFDCVSPTQMRRVQEANHDLLDTAAPLLEQLGRAIANTRFFALLTDAQGVVLASSGHIDPSDLRAERITRVGVDLSEPAIGTSAISAALQERQPVWLHRGEHFFEGNAAYSCAGAPIFGPDGNCVGMVDVTGIDTHERPELRHLVLQTARRMESALVLQRPHALLLRLAWPGSVIGADGDALVALDSDGCVVAANDAARQMLPMLLGAAAGRLPIGDVLGVEVQVLFDAAARRRSAFEVPLWSGLCVQVLALCASQAPADRRRASDLAAGAPLKAVESALIRKAIDAARGNVAQAAQALGISRATLYRKLGRRPGGEH